VGGAPGKIDLYVGKEVIKRAIPMDSVRGCMDAGLGLRGGGARWGLAGLGGWGRRAHLGAVCGEAWLVSNALRVLRSTRATASDDHKLKSSPLRPTTALHHVQACDELVQLIKDNGRWVDPPKEEEEAAQVATVA